MSDYEILQRIKTTLKMGPEVYRNERLSLYQDTVFLWNAIRKLQMTLGRTNDEAEILRAGLKEIRNDLFADCCDAGKIIRAKCDEIERKADGAWLHHEFDGVPTTTSEVK
jgi:hypothetical protein